MLGPIPPLAAPALDVMGPGSSFGPQIGLGGSADPGSFQAETSGFTT